MIALLAFTRTQRCGTCALLVIACASFARGASARCRIVTEKASLEGVTVSVPGERFTLNLEGVPATIHLEQMGKGTTSIQVESPLRFTASYPSMKLGYRIKRDVDLYDGRVHLGKKSGHTWLGVQGDAIRISLTSTLGVDIRRPTIVPCDSIEFENGTAYASPLALSPPSERTIGMGKSFFPLYVAARRSEEHT